MMLVSTMIQTKEKVSVRYLAGFDPDSAVEKSGGRNLGGERG